MDLKKKMQEINEIFKNKNMSDENTSMPKKPSYFSPFLFHRPHISRPEFNTIKYPGKYCYDTLGKCKKHHKSL